MTTNDRSRARSRTRYAAATTALALGLTTAWTAVAGSGAASGEESATGDGPIRYRTIPTQVFDVPGTGRIAVGAPSLKRVMIQRQDAATGAWAEPEVLHQEPGIECGALNGRTSGGGVALLLECDSNWSEDQAPAESVALVSQDLDTWARQTLPGEAYLSPGISPSGEHAVWLAGGHGDVVRWSAGTGFAPLQSTTYDYDSGDPTAVVADDGTVTVLGAEPAADRPRRCVIGVHGLDPDGAVTTDAVDPAPGHRLGCTELRMVGLSSTRVEGVFWSPADTFVIGRDDETSPWRLVQVAPSHAPGLVEHGFRPSTMHTVFSWARNGPMVAIGSPDGQRLKAQLYDAEAQVWGPPGVVYDHGSPDCRWAGTTGGALRPVHQLVMSCGPSGHTRALLSHDSVSWVSVPLRGKPLAVGRGGTPVAAPQARRTTVVSPSGVVRLPVGAPGRCEVVFPTGPDEVVRLHAGRGDRGWPSRLQAHDGERWRTIDRVRMPARGRCAEVDALMGEEPTEFQFRNGQRWVFVRVVRRGERWHAVRGNGY
ncbi:hypothetical protein [Nocardioides ferulae]|uniref:hypothetical protein n=1 Tax=Nocardioides ferulae TaxID=2340821 RepID=UPI000EB3E191|nr:hypothetical protein [Nocardioides ferulae]